MICFYDGTMIIILYPVQRLILYLLRSILYSFLFELLQQVCYWLFYKKLFLCMMVICLLSYIQFIDWFFTCLDLYVVSFHLNHCSLYVICCLTRSDFLLWWWNDYYFISSSTIDSLLAKIYIIFLLIWIIAAGMLLVVLQLVLSLYDGHMLLFLYLVHWLILSLLRSVCCFFVFASL